MGFYGSLYYEIKTYIVGEINSMERKDKIIIVGTALVAAVAGGITYRKLQHHLGENLENARTQAVNHIKAAMDYEN